MKIYFLERCFFDSLEVVLDCILGVLKLDFLFLGGIYFLRFVCFKCDLLVEN